MSFRSGGTGLYQFFAKDIQEGWKALVALSLSVVYSPSHSVGNSSQILRSVYYVQATAQTSWHVLGTSGSLGVQNGSSVGSPAVLRQG